MQETLYVITPIFNPRNFTSRIKLYNQFAKYIADCGAVLITVEVAFANREFQVTDKSNPYHVRLRSPHEMWHKERAINIGIQHLIRLHPEVEKVAWIDADVQFLNPNWIQETLNALDHYDVVQMFSEATSLGPNHEILWKVESAFAHWRKKKPMVKDGEVPLSDLAGGHPGLAWAGTISCLNKLGGLMDFCIHGSGDSHMANALRGDIHTYYLKQKPSNAFLQAFDDWQERCDKYVKRNVGVIDGTCNHYWHGNGDKRGYSHRWGIICYHQFDPFVDIYPAVNGLWQFTGNKPDFEQDLRLSMIARSDDENCLVPVPNPNMIMYGGRMHLPGDKIGDKTLRIVNEAWLKKNPDVKGAKVGELWPM